MSIFLDGLTGKITGSTSTVPVGAFQFFMRSVAPDGWVRGDGGTIGPPGSGAARANSDTQDLYFAWWAEFTDAQLPILTVAGAASARGPSAVADWAAGKRLTVFDVRGRFARATGSINGLSFGTGWTYQDMIQNITGGWNELYGGLQDNSGSGAFRTTGSTTGAAGSNIQVPKASAINFDASRVVRTGLETAPVSIAMLGCFKL